MPSSVALADHPSGNFSLFDSRHYHRRITASDVDADADAGLHRIGCTHPSTCLDERFLEIDLRFLEAFGRIERDRRDVAGQNR